MCKCLEFLEFADDLEFGIPKFRSHGWFSFGRVGVCSTTSLYKRYVREDPSYTHAYLDFPDPTGPKSPGRLQCVGKILTCFSTFANSAIPWAVLIFVFALLMRPVICSICMFASHRCTFHCTFPFSHFSVRSFMLQLPSGELHHFI